MGSQQDPDNVNPTTPCEGSGDFPTPLMCFAGSVMGGVETFTLKFNSKTGTLDIVADGAMPGSLLGAKYTKSGQTISVDKLSDAFKGQAGAPGKSLLLHRSKAASYLLIPVPVTGFQDHRKAKFVQLPLRIGPGSFDEPWSMSLCSALRGSCFFHEPWTILLVSGGVAHPNV